MVELANTAVVRRASVKDAAGTRAQTETAFPDGDALAPLTTVAADQ